MFIKRNEVVIAGLDYKEERKTSAQNFILLATDAGFEIGQEVCFHPTSNSSGTYFILLRKNHNG